MMFVRGTIGFAAVLLAGTGAAWAQSEPAPAPDATPPAQAETSAPLADTAQRNLPTDAPPSPSTDILSGRTLSILLDGRLVAANGHQRFSDGGMSITRFSGAKDGDFQIDPLPIEGDLIWTPRFTSSLAGNVSVAWQRDQEDDVDVMEAFVTFLPPRTGKVSFSAKLHSVFGRTYRVIEVQNNKPKVVGQIKASSPASIG